MKTMTFDIHFFEMQKRQFFKRCTFQSKRWRLSFFFSKFDLIEDFVAHTGCIKDLGLTLVK